MIPVLQLHTSFLPLENERAGLDDTERPFKFSLIDQVEEKR